VILQTKEQQIKFLRACYKNIQRIFSTYLTQSEKSDSSRHNKPHIKYSQNEIAKNLPQTITSGGWLHNVKMGKLYILVNIYNQAAKKMLTANKPLDLDPLFIDVKYQSQDVISDRLHCHPEDVMRSHRRHVMRKMPRRIQGFFTPKSTAFLKKHGFFTTSKKRKMPINEAVRYQNISRLRSLLSNPIRKNEINQKDDYGHGSTPLDLAAHIGNTTSVELLIASGARIGSDCLNSAIQAGNIEILRLLLGKGGDVNTPDSNGKTPLIKALAHVTHATQNLLGENTWETRTDIINLILEQKIDLNAHADDNESFFDYVRRKKTEYSDCRLSKNNPEFDKICTRLAAVEKEIASSTKDSNLTMKLQ
jgi:ankyrin repeat protein